MHTRLPQSLRVITLADVRRALALTNFDIRAAQERMAPYPRPPRPPDAPGNPKLAGVLLLLFPAIGVDSGLDELHFALIRRTPDRTVHSGQISFPGGRQEAEETYEETALREAEEEVGIARDTVEVIGALTSFYVPPSDFEIHPIVGYMPARPVWHPSAAEVAAMAEVPLRALFDDSLKGSETRQRGQITVTAAYYCFDAYLPDCRVWGATAVILSEFEMRLRAIRTEGESSSQP